MPLLARARFLAAAIAALLVATVALGATPAQAAYTDTPTVMPLNTSALISWISEPSTTTGYQVKVVNDATGVTVATRPTATTYLSTATTSYTVTGLTNGTTYRLIVMATTATGVLNYPTVLVTPAAVPNTPALSGTVTGGSGFLKYTWTAATVPAGAPAVSGYRLTLTPYGGGTAIVTNFGVVTTGTVSGLTNGALYTAKLQALNSNGASNYSTTQPTSSPSPVPSAVTGITTSRSADGLSGTISWTAPTNAPNSAITQYVVQFTTGNGATLPTNITLTRPVGGVAATTTNVTFPVATGSYSARVVPYSIAGTGTASAYVAFPAPLTVPNAPTVSATVTGGSGFLKYTWTASSVPAGAGAVLGYEVTLTPNDATPAVTQTFPVGTTGTVTGLVNGKWYTAKVRSWNAAGFSAYGTTQPSASPSPLPTTPLSVATTRSADGLTGTVTWAAPANAPNSAITQYVVQFTTSNGATLPTNITLTRPAGGVAATSTNVTFPSGTGAYSTRVVPYSIAGTGTASAYVAFPAPLTVPNAPTLSATVTGGSGFLKYTWTASTVPAGGSAVQGYELTLTPSDGSAAVVTTFGLVTTGTVSGLVNGKFYTAKLRSWNAAGFSAYATTQPNASPSPVPGLATSIVTTRSTDGLSGTVTWVAPANAPNSAVTKYVLNFSTSNGAPLPANITINRDAAGNTLLTTPVTFTSATGSYSVRIQATSIAGVGSWSAYVPFPNANLVPNQTTMSTTVTGGTGSLTFGWTAATIPTGAPAIDSYRLTLVPSDGSGNVVVTTGVVTSTTVTGLTDGVLYTATVQAHNSAGYALASTTLVEASPAPVPGTVQNLDGDRSADALSGPVTWNSPANAPNYAVTRYDVEYRTLNSAPLPSNTTLNRPAGAKIATTTTATGLSATGQYEVRVLAYTVAGAGSWSAWVPLANKLPPNPVSPTLTDASATTVSLSWPTATVPLGAMPVLGYTVTFTAAGYPTVTSSVGVVNATTVTGLQTGVLYTAVVQGYNFYATAATSPTPVIVAPADIPLAVGSLNVVRDNMDPTTATATWVTPANAPGASITKYVVSVASLNGAPAVSGGTITRVLPAGTTSTTFALSGMSSNGSYRITVTPYTAAGVGPDADFDLLYTFAPPPAPGNVDATPSGSDLVVSWQAPVWSGATINGYEVWWREFGTPDWHTDYASGTSMTLPRLLPGQAVEVAVSATNLYGVGPLSTTIVGDFAEQGTVGTADASGTAAVVNTPTVNAATGDVTNAIVALSVPSVDNPAGATADLHLADANGDPTGPTLATCTLPADTTRCTLTPATLTGTGAEYVVDYTDIATNGSVYVPVDLDSVRQARLAKVATRIWTTINSTYETWAAGHGNQDFGVFAMKADALEGWREPDFAPRVFYRNTDNNGTLDVSGFPAWMTDILDESSVDSQYGDALLPVRLGIGSIDTRLGQFDIKLRDMGANKAEYKAIGFLGNGYDPARDTEPDMPATPVWRTPSTHFMFTPEWSTSLGYIPMRVDEGFQVQTPLYGEDLTIN